MGHLAVQRSDIHINTILCIDPAFDFINHLQEGGNGGIIFFRLTINLYCLRKKGNGIIWNHLERQAQYIVLLCVYFMYMHVYIYMMIISIHDVNKLR